MRYQVFIDRTQDRSAAAIQRCSEAIAERYGLSPAEVTDRLLRGRFRVKRNIDLASAQRFAAELERLGAVCSVEEYRPSKETGKSGTAAATQAGFASGNPTDSPNMAAPSGAAATMMGAHGLGVPSSLPAASRQLPTEVGARAKTATTSPQHPATGGRSDGDCKPVDTQQDLAALDQIGSGNYALQSLDGAQTELPVDVAVPLAIDNDADATDRIDRFSPRIEASAASLELALPVAVVTGTPTPDGDSAARLSVDANPPPGANRALPSGEKLTAQPTSPGSPIPGAHAQPLAGEHTSLDKAQEASIKARLALAGTAREVARYVAVRPRFRSCIGVFLLIVLGFIPAHFIADLREKNTYSAIDRAVESAGQQVKTSEDWQELLQFRAAQLERKSNERTHIVLVSTIIWIAVGGLIGHMWFRRLDWDKLR